MVYLACHHGAQMQDDASDMETNGQGPRAYYLLS